MANTSPSTLWGLVLAGGDGTRLQSLTRLIAGSPIPKQYCRLVGERSLLEETLARVRNLLPPARTLAVVNRDHLPLASAQLATLPTRNVVVQPRNRDTATRSISSPPRQRTCLMREGDHLLEPRQTLGGSCGKSERQLMKTMALPTEVAIRAELAIDLLVSHDRPPYDARLLRAQQCPRGPGTDSRRA